MSVIEWGPGRVGIQEIRIYGPVGEFGAVESYAVGQDVGNALDATVNLITEIRPVLKPGMHANLPYVQVWCGDRLHAEFCQHNIVGVYFMRDKQ